MNPNHRPHSEGRRPGVSFRSLLGILLLILGLALALTACSGPAPDQSADSANAPATDAASAEDSATRAARLAQELLIVDTHIDVPYRLKEEWADIGTATEGGDFDHSRARAGGLDGAFMSIYVPADLQENQGGDAGAARTVADELIDMVEGIVAEHPDKFALATRADDIARLHDEGKVALPLGMENGAPITSLDDLRHFYDRGIRYITLTHSKNNHICDSSYEPADQRTWDGLSDFGRDVVAEMNRLGIMVDISHVSDAAFTQTLEVTRAPAIATHSSARHFTPGFERNMSDEMIRALAENGGVIAINFGSAFLTEAANGHSQARWQAAAAYLEEHGIEPGSDDARAYMQQYMEENPFPYADLADVVAHIDHVVELVGVDHVGLGSDFDGVGDSLPTGLKDAAGYPNLVAALLDAGYSEEDIEKILGGNVLRLWRAVEAAAAEMQGESAELAEAA
ncbi:MAG: dipeptidase [Acidobacteriota bacterium]